MAVKSPHIKFNVSSAGWKEAQSLLEKLPILIRGKALDGAIRAGLNKTKQRAKQLVTQPGYPGDKTKKNPNLTPLRDTIIVAMRRWKAGWLVGGIVGPEYLQYRGGNHGHLVEHGHRIAKGGTLIPLPGSKKKSPPRLMSSRSGKGVHVGDVPPHPFMGPAWEETKDAFESKIIAALQRVVTQNGG